MTKGIYDITVKPNLLEKWERAWVTKPLRLQKSITNTSQRNFFWVATFLSLISYCIFVFSQKFVSNFKSVKFEIFKVQTNDDKLKNFLSCKKTKYAGQKLFSVFSPCNSFSIQNFRLKIHLSSKKVKHCHDLLLLLRILLLSQSLCK